MRQEGYTADKLEQLLNKASGLKVSQVSGGHGCAEGNHVPGGIFVHRLRSSIGAMLASLGD